MKKYEHRTESKDEFNQRVSGYVHTFDRVAEEQYINTMGQSGWELVAVVYRASKKDIPVYYWKREIINEE